MSATAERMQELNRMSADLRIARKLVKQRIASAKDSRGEAARVLVECPPEVAGMKVLDVLLAARRVGVQVARGWLLAEGVSETLPVEALSDVRRRELADRVVG